MKSFVSQFYIPLLAFSLSGCLGSGGGTSQASSTDLDGDGNNIEIITKEKNTLTEKACVTIGYEAIKSKVFDVLGIPQSADAGTTSFEDFFTPVLNQDAIDQAIRDGAVPPDPLYNVNVLFLGGTGASADFECDPMYFKAATAVMTYACEYLVSNDPLYIFPFGIDYPDDEKTFGTLFNRMMNVEASDEEIAEVKNLVEDLGSLNRLDKMKAACVAVGSSIGALTL